MMRIPRGCGHLPADRMAPPTEGETGSGAVSFVLDATHWSAAVSAGSDAREQPSDLESEGRIPAPRNAVFETNQASARILIADDNADMREYLARLLAPHWRVQTAEDGQTAVEIAVQDPRSHSQRHYDATNGRSDSPAGAPRGAHDQHDSELDRPSRSLRLTTGARAGPFRSILISGAEKKRGPPRTGGVDTLQYRADTLRVELSNAERILADDILCRQGRCRSCPRRRRSRHPGGS
jgi:hypothetical protein